MGDDEGEEEVEATGDENRPRPKPKRPDRAFKVPPTAAVTAAAAAALLLPAICPGVFDPLYPFGMVGPPLPE